MTDSAVTNPNYIDVQLDINFEKISISKSALSIFLVLNLLSHFIHIFF